MSNHSDFGQEPENNRHGGNGQEPNNKGGLGQRISNSVLDALQTGDLSKLNEIGPAIQEAVKDIPGVHINTSGSMRGRNNSRSRGTIHTNYSNTTITPSGGGQVPSPAWMGQGTMKKRRGPSGGAGILSIVLGSVWTGLFGLGLLISFLVGVVGFQAEALTAAAVFGFLTAGGGMVLVGGLGRRKQAKAIWQYYDLLEQKPVRTFKELAVCTGKSEKEVKKEIKKAMRSGLMSNVQMDMDETCVMYGPNAYQDYMNLVEHNQKKMLEERENSKKLEQNADLAALEEFKQKGVSVLRAVRDANDAIPGQQISEKLERLENVTSRIFAYVEKHPEKLPDTRKFMDYYLPTTLKLVNKYRQYEENEMQVDNIVKAKKEIEDTLETINTAFNNLLNNLYQDDTLDVSTDIEVLQAMLAQEGLTGSQFEIGAKNEDDNPLRL